MVKLQASQFSYQADRKVYAAEISELQMNGVPREIELDGALFTFSHTDTDASGEDIAGWNYQVTMGGVFWNKDMAGARILIIND